MKDVRIAVVVFNAPVGKSRDNLARMEHWINRAKKEKASLICFPEMNITGYSTRNAIRKAAVSASGIIVKTLTRLAVESHMAILAGIAEKDKKGRIFASQIVTFPDETVGVYRKLHLAPPEQAIFSAGNEMPVFETFGLKFGIQLCYDAHFPELSTHMALKNVDVIFMPHASPNGTSDEKYRSWLRHLPARAYDNSVFIIACNQTGANECGLEFPGISMAVGPSGEVIEKELSNKESMIICELNADRLDRVRNHKMRYFLPHRRSDLFP